jgi:hypothetical protein
VVVGWSALFYRVFIGRFILVLHAIHSVPEPFAHNQYM